MDKPQLSAADILSKAADLIEPPGAWTQFARGRDAKGIWEQPRSPKAVCWCIVGALERVDPTEYPDEYRHPALKYVAKVVRRANPSHWNDGINRKQRQVVAALRKAADLARAEGSDTQGNSSREGE